MTFSNLEGHSAVWNHYNSSRNIARISYDTSRGARGAVRAPPSWFMGTIIFLFFRSLSKVENLSSRKKTVIFHVYYIKIKTALYASQNCAFGGSDITHLKISPTFVLFGHVVRCFLQYLSLLSILCTSKYIYYLILHFCYQKRCENTMFLQSAIVKCIFFPGSQIQYA